MARKQSQWKVTKLAQKLLVFNSLLAVILLAGISQAYLYSTAESADPAPTPDPEYYESITVWGTRPTKYKLLPWPAGTISAQDMALLQQKMASNVKKTGTQPLGYVPPGKDLLIEERIPPPTWTPYEQYLWESDPNWRAAYHAYQWQLLYAKIHFPQLANGYTCSRKHGCFDDRTGRRCSPNFKCGNFDPAPVPGRR